MYKCRILKRRAMKFLFLIQYCYLLVLFLTYSYPAFLALWLMQWKESKTLVYIDKSCLGYFHLLAVGTTLEWRSSCLWLSMAKFPCSYKTLSFVKAMLLQIYTLDCLNFQQVAVVNILQVLEATDTLDWRNYPA